MIRYYVIHSIDSRGFAQSSFLALPLSEQGDAGALSYVLRAHARGRTLVAAALMVSSDLRGKWTEEGLAV